MIETIMNNEEEDAADDDDVAVSMKMLKMMYVDRVCWQPLFGRTPSQVLSEKPQPPDDKATIALHASLNQSKAQQEINRRLLGSQ